MGGSDNKGGKVKSNGMPDMLPDEKTKDGLRFYATPLISAIVTLLIGFGIAMLIYTFGSKTTYEAKIAAIKAAEQQWIYLAVVIFGRTVLFVNFYPMGWKG